jgi:hypothetical protein
LLFRPSYDNAEAIHHVTSEDTGAYLKYGDIYRRSLFSQSAPGPGPGEEEEERSGLLQPEVTATSATISANPFLKLSSHRMQDIRHNNPLFIHTAVGTGTPHIASTRADDCSYEYNYEYVSSTATGAVTAYPAASAVAVEVPFAVPDAPETPLGKHNDGNSGISDDDVDHDNAVGTRAQSRMEGGEEFNDVVWNHGTTGSHSQCHNPSAPPTSSSSRSALNTVSVASSQPDIDGMVANVKEVLKLGVEVEHIPRLHSPKDRIVVPRKISFHDRLFGPTTTVLTGPRVSAGYAVGVGGAVVSSGPTGAFSTGASSTATATAAGPSSLLSSAAAYRPYPLQQLSQHAAPSPSPSPGGSQSHRFAPKRPTNPAPTSTTKGGGGSTPGKVAHIVTLPRS